MRNLRPNRWGGDDRGNVAVWFALASLALAGLGGGAVTMTRLDAASSRLQDLADGVALAATILAQDVRATDAQILDAAARFGRTATAGGTEEFDSAAMTVEIVKRSPAEVTVSLTQDVRTVLAAFVGRDRITIDRRATAVSGPERRTCLYVLDPAAAPALRLQGSPDLVAPDCVVQVNSNGAGALHAESATSGRTQATYVAGPAGSVRRWSPAPVYGQPQRPDPLAAKIAWPAPIPETDCIGQRRSDPDVLKPGHYCSSLVIGRNVRLEPGVYVVQSGGVRVEGSGVQARGVAIVLLDPAGEFDVRGGASLSLTAPKDGAWAGVAVAARPGPALTTSRWGGSAAIELDGTIYLPGHKLELQGSPKLNGAGDTRALIVRQLAMQGSPTLNLAGGHPSGHYGAVRLTR